jgi:hypothetical protein
MLAERGSEIDITDMSGKTRRHFRIARLTQDKRKLLRALTRSGLAC